MKIIIAPDSFKGCMNSAQVCSAVEEGILRAKKDVTIIKIPLADGGEGTARAITLAAGGRFIKTNVTDPLGRKIEAVFGLIENDKTAVLDIAGACGLELLDRNELNPMKASSYGAGELITAALNTGVNELIIGIGGSAVNDGGIGMLSALGFKFLDCHGNPVGFGGEALSKIASIDCNGAVSLADNRLKKTSIKVACDVTNPLTGINGASAIFGPQKGATEEMVKVLDDGLVKLTDAFIKAGLTESTDKPGDGAAGGIGAALRICAGAKMESGAMLVMKYAGFFNHLCGADLIITGEGMTDDQTASGKLCSVVAAEAKKAGVSAALLSGALSGEKEKLFSIFDYAVSIACGETGLEAMIKNSRQNLIFAAENLIRAIELGKGMG